MKKLVVIGAVFPEPNSTAAGKRMLQLLDFFIGENFEITFLSTASVSEFSFDLRLKDIQFQQIALNDEGFEVLIKEISPDVVLFDRFISEEQFGWKISEICPNAIKILDTEDLHFLRKAREIAFKQNKNVEFEDLISDIFKREIASILRCDLSLIISDFEMDLLQNQFKIDENILFYLPIFAEPKPSEKSFTERKNFISIGNFLHEPNWQTVLKIKQIWPEIHKKIPDAEIHIYGAYLPEKALQLHNEKEKFLVKGRAENLENLYENYRVMLAPIPFGAGIKGKLLESMQFGIPNITTEIGAEGMRGNLDWNGFICNSDDEIIKKSIQIYNDENLWTNSVENGFKILESRFNSNNFLPKFSDKISEISSNLQNHRNRNFLGQILQHHSLQSTKYLGKWIEEKNKVR